MSPKTRSLALLGVLVHFLIVNLLATFGLFPGIPLGFRNLTLLFSAVLIADIGLIVKRLCEGKFDEQPHANATSQDDI